MSKQVITIWSKRRNINYVARTMQYGFEAHAVKTWTISAADTWADTFNCVYNFALRAFKDVIVNRLITDSKSTLRTRLLSLVMRDKALSRSPDTVVRISLFTHNNTAKNRKPQIFSLEILGPNLVLLCKFSLYWAVRAPIGARALRLQPHQPHGHGWSGPGNAIWMQTAFHSRSRVYLFISFA